MNNKKPRPACKYANACFADCADCDGEKDTINTLRHISTPEKNQLTAKDTAVRFGKNMAEIIEIDNEAYQILMRYVLKRSQIGEDSFSGAIRHMENVISSQKAVMDEIEGKG
ncbi:MAG: hypothetical protein O8C61_03225 [Candidatus Methanoperedens sp.]|nr:hypothetical protein [Candidatus Methanoperedens sp.]